jgi:N-acetylglucosamine-6-phosphate deacetylase
MMRFAGRHYESGEPIVVEARDGLIADIAPWREPGGAMLPWIAPGLVDLQVNGYGGEEFTDGNLTVDAVRRISAAVERDGVTTYLPTVVTASLDLHLHVLRTIADAMTSCETVRRRVAGIHLEGPYISAADGPRGAHPLEHCRAPNWDEFRRLQDAASGHIKLLTISPEFAAAAEFIRRVVASGVLVSIGHTNADAEQIRAAVDAGARMSTHLGNGAPAYVHRHRNCIWDQLADDRLTATIIADGHHLPPAVVKCLVRGKTPERLVLISDITGMAGSAPGCYERSGLGQIEVLPDGRAVVAGQREYLAGATQPLHLGVTNVMRFAGVTLREAVDMASARPAQLLHCHRGRLAPGYAADLVQFHLPEGGGGMQILATIKDGMPAVEEGRAETASFA